MSDDVAVRGAEDVRSLSRAIRAHADRRALQKELYAGLNRATKGIRADMKAAVPGAAPKSGGMAAIAARGARLSTRTSGSAANPGVRIVATSKRGQLVNLNAGRLRHPVWGNRRRWVDQTAGVDGGFLDREFSKASPEVQRELQRVLDDIAAKVGG